MHGNCQSIERLKCEERNSRLETERIKLQGLLEHEGNRNHAKNITGSQLLFQELLKQHKSEMDDSTTCEFELPLHGLPKHFNNMVYKLQMFDQKRPLLEFLKLLKNKTRREVERS